MDSCPIAGEIEGTDYLKEFYRRAEASGVPLQAGIEITERCNLFCVHCYLGDQNALRRRRGEELGAERWGEILQEIADLGVLQLLITGGDPLLRQDFPVIYRRAKELGFFVTVFTNGTLITPAILDLFQELPPRTVEISLYGATEETYEAITKSPGSFKRCMAGIELLRGLGVRLRLKTVLMKPNRDELPQIASLCRSLGNDRFRFATEIHGAFDNLGPLSVRMDPDNAVTTEFSDPERADDFLRYWQRRRGERPADPERLYNCGAAISGFHINAYGFMQPCLSARHILFNLSQGTVGEGLRDLRAQLTKRRAPGDRRCNDCTYRMVCNNCPAFSFLESGHEEYPSEFQCRLTQARVEWVSRREVA